MTGLTLPNATQPYDTRNAPSRLPLALYALLRVGRVEVQLNVISTRVQKSGWYLCRCCNDRNGRSNYDGLFPSTKSPLSGSARRSKLDFASSRRSVDLMRRILRDHPTGLSSPTVNLRSSPVWNEEHWVGVSAAIVFVQRTAFQLGN